MNTPYYAVIFTSTRTTIDDGYNEMAVFMEKLARKQPGFIGMESAREEIGITVSYWQSLEAIANWKKQIDHKKAQKKGMVTWYKNYKVRICLVERSYEFTKDLR